MPSIERTLLLLRHAKSSWDDPACDDFERPLAGRGRRAAPLIGRYMAERGWLPEMAIVSPALRTRQTWDLVAAELPCVPDLAFDETIYEAAPTAILGAVRQVPDRVSTLLVVGHNPGLEGLAEALASPASNEVALQRLASKYPTGALAAFILNTNWAGLDRHTARLTDFITPAELSPREA